MNAIRRILTFLLIIPLGMIVYVFISPDWQWNHPNLEFPFLVIGIPIVVLNFLLWFQPEFFRTNFSLKVKPIQISEEKFLGYVRILGGMLAFLLIGVGVVSALQRVSARPVPESTVTPLADIADFQAVTKISTRTTEATEIAVVQGPTLTKSPEATETAEGTVTTQAAGALETPVNTEVVQVPVSGGTPTSTPVTPGVPTPTTNVSATPTNTSVSSTCKSANTGFFTLISEEVQYADSDNELRTAWAVQSKAVADLWFVAAKIYKTGSNNAGTLPGVWAVFTFEDGYFEVYAINDVAQEYTFTAWGEDSDPVLTMGTDGAQSVYNCALQGN